MLAQHEQRSAGPLQEAFVNSHAEVSLFHLLMGWCQRRRKNPGRLGGVSGQPRGGVRALKQPGNSGFQITSSSEEKEKLFFM